MTIYEDDAPHVLGAVVTLMILAYSSYALRVYVRYGKTWGMEDWAMTVATVSFFFLPWKQYVRWRELIKTSSGSSPSVSSL